MPWRCDSRRPACRCSAWAVATTHQGGRFTRAPERARRCVTQYWRADSPRTTNHSPLAEGLPAEHVQHTQPRSSGPLIDAHRAEWGRCRSIRKYRWSCSGRERRGDSGRKRDDHSAVGRPAETHGKRQRRVVPIRRAAGWHVSESTSIFAASSWSGVIMFASVVIPRPTLTPRCLHA